MTDHDLQTTGKLSAEGELVPGLDRSKARLLSAAIELGRRRTALSRIVKNKISSSRDVYNRYVDRLSDLGHEEFHILLLKGLTKCLQRSGFLRWINWYCC